MESKGRKVAMFISILKKSIFAAACLFGTVFFPGCSSVKPVTIATYNIQIGLGMDKKYDLNRTAEAIRKIGAETVVLNEVDVKTHRSQGDDQPAILAGKLKMNYVFGEASKRKGGIYGNAVLSVHKVEKLDVIALPANEYESRSALVVKIHAPKPYYVISTHFSYEQTAKIKAVRLKCVDLLADYVKKKKYFPVLLCGDLNSYHDSEVIRRVQEQGFQIVNDLSGKMRSYPSRNPRRLLDYLCIYPADSVKAENARVIQTQASDHCPVAAEFLFK